ncbi:MAG: AMP-binding protein [Rhodobacteraceae bacterium]|nr:AMP-binding protein [Paracoccaceae bacterium]
MERVLSVDFEIGPFAETSYADARTGFSWPELERFNIAEAICGRWAAAEPDRTALIHLGEDDQETRWSYARLDRDSNRLANAFAGLGLQRGDCCAILLPQRPEAVLTHLALYKLGAVALPLFSLFGEDALAFRLSDAGAKLVVTDGANLPKLLAAKEKLPKLSTILSVSGPGHEGTLGFWETMARAQGACTAVETSPEDPAFLCYTSGTTGPPKGALHAHRTMLGHLPGVQMWLEGVPQPQDVAWTPADWAWMGGLCNVLMPCLYYGVPLVSHRMAKFDPEHAFWIWERFKVTVGFIPPTALKMMRSADEGAPHDLSLRAIGCGGEALGSELLGWGRERLGLTINEFYGQTECNLVASNRASWMPVKPGSIGPATPGFELAILDGDGAPVVPGAPGEIAVKRGNMSMFLEYWGRPDATEKKFAGDWLLTGDEGRMDEEGYVFFEARADDVITSAGYRIGPSEIEDCLTGHPAVAAAGVVGAPDPVRGEMVAAFVVLRRGYEGGEALAKALQAHVADRLSPHLAPRDVRVVEELPMTATGKILRRELKTLI